MTIVKAETDDFKALVSKVTHVDRPYYVACLECVPNEYGIGNELFLIGEMPDRFYRDCAVAALVNQIDEAIMQLQRLRDKVREEQV